jgi:hypothetical protein
MLGEHSNKAASIIPPSSKQAEIVVLGCMLSSAHGFNQGIKELEENDFFFAEHKIIFQALKRGHSERNHPGDVHLLCEELRRQDKLNTVGGLAYLLTLAQAVGTSSYVEEYIDILKEKSMLRESLHLAKKIQERALKEENPEQILFEVEAQSKKNQQKGSRGKFPIRFLSSWEENFLLSPPPKKPMLLEYINDQGNTQGFLPKGIVAMLVGAGGVGKTHLLSQLALSIATGRKWLNMFRPTPDCGPERKGNVFLGLGENQYDDIHRVLYKASKHLRKTHQEALLEASEKIDSFSFCGQQSSFLTHGRPSAYFHELKKRLQDRAPIGGWALVILDPVSRLMGIDAETDNAAATQFISLLEELSIELPGKPAILFAHHMNKSSVKEGKTDQTAARGSSALTDGVRWQLNFSRGENPAGEEIGVLKLTKSNFTPQFREIKVKKDDEGVLELYWETDKKIDSFKVEKKWLDRPLTDLFFGG